MAVPADTLWRLRGSRKADADQLCAAWFARSNSSRPMIASCTAQIRKFYCAPNFCRAVADHQTRCRTHDQSNTGAPVMPSPYSSSHRSTAYPLFSTTQEPRDIIPRASPSRPSSARITSPMSPDHSRTSAMSALKSISIRSPTPPSPVGTYHGSGIWPFGRAATSPSNSYSRPASGLYSSTYDGAYFGTASANLYGTSSERPLPIRRPGIYSRPKSIELVTPMVGR